MDENLCDVIDELRDEKRALEAKIAEVQALIKEAQTLCNISFEDGHTNIESLLTVFAMSDWFERLKKSVSGKVIEK